MEIVEPLKADLEEIKMTCEKLEQRSAEAQAENSLSDMEEFQSVLRRVSELRRRSGEALFVTVTMLGIIGDLLMYVWRIFRVVANPEEDKQLTDAIMQSADQSRKTVYEFDKMSTELREFTGNAEKYTSAE